MSDQQSVRTGGVSASYTFNKEESGECLIQQMRQSRGTNLIGPLLAHSHAIRGLEDYERARHKHTKPAQVEPFNLTLLYSDRLRAPASLPKSVAPMVPAMSTAMDTEPDASAGHDRDSGVLELETASAVAYSRSPATPVAIRNAILMPITPATSVSKAASTTDEETSSQTPKSAKKSTTEYDGEKHSRTKIKPVKQNIAANEEGPPLKIKKNVKRVKPFESKPIKTFTYEEGSSDIPQSISDLVAEIEAIKRNSSGLPVRAPLKGEEKFRAHFDRSVGRLRAESALMKWYGDTRLFSKQWWEYLVAETPAKKNRTS